MPYTRKEINLKKVETIVLEGCGVRWHAYDGALEALSRVIPWQQIQKIAATSGGSMPAFLSAIGNTPQQIKDVTFNLDLQELMDPVFISKIPYVGFVTAFLLYHGYIQGNKIQQFAEAQLEKNKLDPHITFAQLAKLKETTRPELKYLFLSTSIVTRGSHLLVFSHKKTPHVRIAEALAAALAYPCTSIPKDVLIGHQLETLFDGGVRNNFIMSYFADELDKVLGLKIDTYNEIFGFPQDNPSTGEFLYSLIQDNYNDYLQDWERYSLQLYDCGLTTLNYPFTPLQKFALDVSGTTNMLQFAKLPGTFAELPPKEEESNDDEALVSARTTDHLNLLRNGKLDFEKTLHEIAFWDKENETPFIFYSAFLKELRKQSSSFWNSQSYKNLCTQLKESAAAQAKKYKSLASDISDVLMNYILDGEYKAAYDYLQDLQKDPIQNCRLIDIDHTVILKNLKSHWGLRKPTEFYQLQNLLEVYYEGKLRLHPGAYEGYLVMKLNQMLTDKQFTEAYKMFTDNKFACLYEDLEKKLYEITQKELEKHNDIVPPEFKAYITEKTQKPFPPTNSGYTQRFFSYFSRSQPVPPTVPTTPTLALTQ